MQKRKKNNKKKLCDLFGSQREPLGQERQQSA